MLVVKVVWYDSKGVTSEWEFKDEIKPLSPAVVTSVGYLWQENKDYVTIVQSDSDEQLMGGLTIPRACIECMNTLLKETKIKSE